MKSELEELIEAYEIEKTELEKQISEYVSEGEYIYAHHHNRALNRVNKKLYILKDLQNPLSRSISEAERRANGIKTLTAQTNSKDYNDFIREMIEEEENKILELKRTSLPPAYDGQEIDDALFDLEKGSIKGFKLYFKTSPDVFVSFTSEKSNIKITLFYDSNAYQEYHNIFENGNQLTGLGFRTEEGQWVYRYHFDRFKNALEIKTILARLIYDLFGYERRYDSAKIVFD